MAFPEETALLLKAYEGKLFKAIGMRTLLSSVVHSMSKKTNSSLRAQPEDYDLFQKLVSHFYLVSDPFSKSEKLQQRNVCEVHTDEIHFQTSK